MPSKRRKGRSTRRSGRNTRRRGTGGSVGRALKWVVPLIVVLIMLLWFVVTL